MSYLSEHFFSNLWDGKDDDYKRIYQLTRVTKHHGTLTKVSVLDTLVLMPTEERYHLFSFGLRGLRSLSLREDTVNNIQTPWINLAETMNDKTTFNVWVSNGIEVPLSDCFIARTKHDIAVLAIKDTPLFPLLKSESVYFHHYTNSIRTSLTIPPLWYKSTPVMTQSAITTHTLAVAAKETEGGKVHTFKNGLLLPSFKPSDVSVGDVITSYHDASVYKNYQYHLATLNVITHQYTDYYTVVSPDTAPLYESIEDLDFFICGKKNGVLSGITLFPNKETDFIQVLNNIYLLSLERVYRTAKTLLNFVDEVEASQLSLVVYYKRSDQTKMIYGTKHHLSNFSGLPHDIKVNALSGDISGPEELRVESRLTSDYNIIRRQDPFISDEEALSFYGIHAFSKALLSDVTISDGLLKLPPAFTAKSVVLQYDQNGLYIGSLFQRLSPTVPLHQDCVKVRVLNGTQITTEQFVVAQPNQDRLVKFYQSDLSGFMEGCNVIEVSVTDIGAKDTIVRYEDDVFIQQSSVAEVGGLLTVRLGEVDRLWVPFGYYEVYLNGRKLIDGLDYCVEFPFVYLFNKSFIVTTNEVTVVAYGFPTPTITPVETGTVRYGLVSYDQTANLFDNKYINVFVDGKLIDQGDLPVDFEQFSALNGLQYELVADTVFTGFLGSVTAELVNEERQNEEPLRLFYDKYVTETDRPVMPVVTLHKVYSPYLSVIIDDMMEGVITDSDCASATIYQRLLQGQYAKWRTVDPILTNHPAVAYCEMHLSYQQSVALTRQQFKVLRQLVQTYPAFNRMDLRNIQIEG